MQHLVKQAQTRSHTNLVMITSKKLFRWSLWATLVIAVSAMDSVSVSAQSSEAGQPNGNVRNAGQPTTRGSRQRQVQQAKSGQQRRPSTQGSMQRNTQRTIQRSNQRSRQSMVARAATGSIPSQMPEAPLDGSLVRGNIKQVGFLDQCQNGCGAVCDCDSGFAGPAMAYGEASCGVDMGYGCGCGGMGCDGCSEISCGVETMISGPSCDGLANGCNCNQCSSVERIPFFLPLFRVQWCRFEFFAGVQGFKGPLNFANTNTATPASRSGSGSFGFYQGFNEGRSLKRWLGWDLAAQLGVRATQSNLSGSEFTEEKRQQVFVTGGLFRRVDYGLQYGFVIDYLNDDWWFQSDLTQIRGELSWKTEGCDVFGLQFMAGLGSDSSSTIVRQADGTSLASTIDFEPTDQYRLFYRRLLKHSGQWEAFAGWTDNDDGLLGASLSMPLRQKLVLATGATFLIPREGDSSGGHQEEGWNISLGLVYRPGGPKGCGRYCRPLFDVADNGTFMADVR